MSLSDVRQASEADVVGYLLGRGALDPARARVATAHALTGGVSGETVLVEAGPTRLVVKRALARLLVAGEWTAKPERAMTEAAAITLAHSLTPHQAPELVDADAKHNVVVMNAAPADWVNWRAVLLGDVADPSTGIVEVAAELGAVLRQWQQQTWHRAAVAEQFDDYEAFEQLRVGPFHRAVAQAHPTVAGRVRECAEDLLSRRDCFVHGDFSPKNVLVGASGLMVLDFEVAHFGAAVFDLAFMTSHLVLKAMHRRDRAGELAAAGAALLRSYAGSAERPGAVSGQATGTDAPVTSLPMLGSHTACLLLARVDGVSPAPYLDQDTRGLVRQLSLDLLAADDPSVDDVWARAMELVA